MKVWEIKYQFRWQKDTNATWFGYAYVHAETAEEAGKKFGVQYFETGTFYEVTESSLAAELVHKLEEAITFDNFTENVEGIDVELAQDLIATVLDITRGK